MGEHFYGDVGPCTFSAANEWLKAGLKIAFFFSKNFFSKFLGLHFESVLKLLAVSKKKIPGVLSARARARARTALVNVGPPALTQKGRALEALPARAARSLRAARSGPGAKFCKFRFLLRFKSWVVGGVLGRRSILKRRTPPPLGKIDHFRKYRLPVSFLVFSELL